ncbi:MetQ/NlpA family ABC transporter substrate-binding protein [Bradyrhizobium sp. U87765 SZCCT0131]|uniref:MetQ/NlpA family ABC transporter substrate-binding protein n=1 Tax=unclassified Bradyrhizobium TaxID=2631580 RepID=UPI001BA5A9EA|nr:MULTISPECIES: MetQ/NlpA family ABC transporter substrate-binding protein [unclassified Bradyrhizobium]MBR1218213.1 MetQ/NlpA family ABC transporter substrate-binding protein [Bradyrhizobium sp. U87765 SZCCT0131]MBR1260841.1 MetQ/NlpA family ABC transporter substrate-binding protein [Bradyrhizobium sp. U87765 SZCCT0134]MBR1303711.1 MetQ/NlpA family ABC transporter substrate-binding protein [Bradyrhizobium sp. U87765 SZCCT0110]MBR1319317.1 MetQ/NlpA family ABC transporter substrate-binding pro
MLRSLAIRAATAVAIALTATAAHADQPLRLAVSAGPLAQLVEFVATRAKSKGLDIKIIETTDWVTPNEAVFSGDIDANFFQHSANLAIQNAARGYNLVAADPAGVIVPVGLFSKRIKNLDELSVGAKVAIPNDPINSVRGLQLLQRAGLIRLDTTAGFKITQRDIIDNPKKLQIVELDAAQTYRSLDDVSIAMVNLTYLIPAGGDPKSALLLDKTPDEQFIIRFITRPEKKDDPRLKALLAEFRTDDVRAFIAAKLPAFIPAF